MNPADFSRLILGRQGDMLGNGDQGYLHAQLSADLDAQLEALYPVGELAGENIGLAVLKPDAQIDFEPARLRSLLAVAGSEREYVLLSRAAQLTTWHNQHRFCGRCGTATVHHEADLAKHCPTCSLVQYPRISPCIIVLIVKGDECLLARSPRFPPGRFSTLAGFIEAGESAEDAVHREVFEEVAIKIRNVRYVKSQSWPFPHSLMLGFLAEYDSGELEPDGVEIEAAGWFRREAMPDLPPAFAISAALIQRFLDNALD